MCLMDNVLSPYLDNFFIFFIGDILKYSKNEEKYIEHIKEILRFLRENQLYARLSQCSLF